MADERNKQLLEMIQRGNPNFHPMLILADIAADSMEDSNTRVSAAKGMMPYLEPQLKAIEVRGNMRADFGVLKVSILDEDSLEEDESEETQG